MRRVLIVAILLSFTTFPITAGSSEETTVQRGVVFGGASIAANDSGAVELAFTELPEIAEDYTATWCDNCVYVEEALHDVAAQRNAEIIYFHRNNDVEDPFGSESGEAWWTRRYDAGIPPTIVFNGEEIQAGSIAEGASLKDDFTAKYPRGFELGNGDSQFIWTAGQGPADGAFAWSLQYDSKQELFAQASAVHSWLFILEDSAHFAEGSNGVEDYVHVVHEIIDLGFASEGVANITLPQAWDDDDLTLMLIHEIEVFEEEPIPVQDDGGFLPAIGLLATMSMLILAATRRRQSSD